MRESLIKSAIRATVFPPGAVRRIRFGPLRGYRFQVGAVTGMAPWYSGAERPEQDAIGRALKSGARAIDVGANWGLHTLLMARVVGPSGSVWAIEPCPSVVESLRWHVAANGCAQVTVHACAAFDRDGEVCFAEGVDPTQGHVAKDGTSVPARRLDTLWRDAGSPPVAFIKIDVEGAERQVLAGAEALIGACRPVLLIGPDSMFPDAKVYAEQLRRLGYRFTRLQDGRELTHCTYGHPAPDGFWGTILARPVSREHVNDEPRTGNREPL